MSNLPIRGRKSKNLPEATYRYVADRWLQTLDYDRTAAELDVPAKVIRRIINHKTTQAYLNHRIGQLEAISNVATVRLLEQLLKQAFTEPGSNAVYSDRMILESQKMLRKVLLPEIRKIDATHTFFVATPPKDESASSWAERNRHLAGGTIVAEEIQDAEVVDGDEDADDKV